MSNGMSFINNRWVFTGGPDRYKKRPNDDGTFMVMSCNAAGERPVYGGRNLSEADADAMIVRLSARRN